jgi:hypothetical protein
MSAPNRSRALHVAINQVYPALPSLLGADFPAFDAKLQQSTDSQLLDLFESHPPAYNQLLNHVAVLSINPSFLGDSIFGNPQLKNSIIYHCQAGNHDVPLVSVQQRTPTGDPICPYHGNPMVVQVQP